MLIDVHAHVTGPEELYAYLDGFDAVSGSGGQGLKRFPVSDELLEASLAGHLAEVTAAGIDFQLISPQPWSIPTGERRGGVVANMTRQLNNLVAQAVTLHPERFAGIAGLPQSPGLKPKDAREEIDRTIGELGFVGVKINPDPGEGGWEAPDMGDEYWYPIFEKLVEYDVPGLIEAGPFRFSRESEHGYFLQEESVACWALLRNYQLWHDFPELKIVIGHGGGYVPYQYGRARSFRNGRESNRGGEGLWETFEDSLQRLYYDTVLFDEPALELLFRLCGPDRCLFGSDKPGIGSVVDPATGRAMNDIKPLIDKVSALSDEDRSAVYEGNARRIFSRLKLPASA